MSEGHPEETVPGLRAQKVVVSRSVRGQTTERLGALLSPDSNHVLRIPLNMACQAISTILLEQRDGQCWPFLTQRLKVTAGVCQLVTDEGQGVAGWAAGFSVGYSWCESSR